MPFHQDENGCNNCVEPSNEIIIRSNSVVFCEIGSQVNLTCISRNEMIRDNMGLLVDRCFVDFMGLQPLDIDFRTTREPGADEGIGHISFECRKNFTFSCSSTLNQSICSNEVTVQPLPSTTSSPTTDNIMASYISPTIHTPPTIATMESRGTSLLYTPTFLTVLEMSLGYFIIIVH